MQYILSNHAQSRIQQRGIKKRDLKLIIRGGTLVAKDGILMRRKDIQREIAIRKAEIQALEKLDGTKIVMSEDGTIITVIRTSKSHQKWLNQKGRKK